MNKPVLALSTLALAFALVGCGGGAVEGSSSTSANAIRVITNVGDQVAVQDGSSAWKTLPVSLDGKYSFDVTDLEGRYGIASLNIINQGKAVHATRAEMTTVDLSTPVSNTHTVNTALTGTPADATAIYYGSMWNYPLDFTSGSAMLTALTATSDIVVYRIPDVFHLPTAIVLKRGISASTSSVSVDWTSAVSLIPATLTSSVPVGYTFGGSVSFKTANNLEFLTMGPLSYMPAIGSSLDFMMVPVGSTLPSDYYEADIWAFDSSHQVQRTARITGGGLLGLPSPYDPATPLLLTSSAPILMAFSNLQDVPTSAQMKVVVSVDVPSLNSPSLAITLTKGWISSRTSYSMPNLSALSGWNSFSFPKSTLRVEQSILTTTGTTKDQTTRTFRLNP